MGLSGAYAGPRIYPIDRGRPLQRRLHDQLGIQRLSRHPRPHVRPALRTRLPARPRRKRAGRDLPFKARRRRLQRRYPRPTAETRRRQKRQAHRTGRRRTGFARGGARSRADGLRMHRVRPGSEVRRHDAHPDSRNSGCRKPSSTRSATTSSISASNLSAANASTASRHCWPRTSTPSSSAAARRAAATWRFPAARKPPRTSISASIGCPAFRSATSPRSANASSCSAAATPRWIAAAPRAGSAARRSKSSSARASRR